MPGPVRLRAAALALAGLSFALPAAAQEDAGFLERQIQNALGGEGREVSVQGLSGALSSEATIDRITVADDDGVWLTIRDVALDWRRVALIRRRLEIEALTVGMIEIARRPLPVPGEPPALAADPDPQPFALPDLPVSVNVAQLSVGALRLGEPVLGQAAALSLNGNARLAGGAGELALEVVRIDGHESRYALQAGYDNETTQTRIDVDLREAADGLIGTLAGIPGQPPLSLSVAGEGPLDDFAADLALRTDGVDRLSGEVALAAVAGEAPGTRTIAADLGGDVAELFLPDYRDFFGRNLTLALRARQGPEIGLDVDSLALRTRGMNLSGTADLNAAYLPVTVDLTARLGTEIGLPVVLPVPGPPLLVHTGTVDLVYDEADGDRFRLDVAADGVMRADGLLIDSLGVNASGNARKTGPAEIAGVLADLTARVRGFSSTDPALWDAVGDGADLSARIDWTRGGPLRLPRLDVVAGDLTLQGSATATGLEAGTPAVSAELAARAGDLSRFAAISGQDLGGALQAQVSADHDLPSGAFDVALDGRAQDLTVGVADADGLLAGDVALGVSAVRDTAGLRLERLQVDGERLSLDGSAALAANGFPRAVRLSGRVGSETGAPVILPAPGAVTTMQRAALDLSYDADEGQDFTLRLDARDLRREGLARLGRANVDADGRIVPDAGGVAGIGALAARVTADVSDAGATEPGLDAVLRPGAQFVAGVDWQAAAGTVALRGLFVRSGEAQLTGAADLAGLDTGAVTVDSRIDLATGPLARFAELAGQPVSGRATLGGTARFAAESGDFAVDLAGGTQDLAVGVAEADRLLAGRTDLAVQAAREAGALRLDRLQIDGRRIALDGTAALDPEGFPQAVQLTGRIADDDGAAVALPVPGAATTLRSADIALDYDAAQGRDFTISLSAADFVRDGLAEVGRLAVDARGELTPDAGGLAGIGAVGARLTAELAGASAADPGLDAALRPGAALSADLDWQAAAGTLAVDDLELTSGAAGLAATARLAGLDTGALTVDVPALDLATGPLARFAGLAGQSLSGSATASGALRYATDTGFFDVDLEAAGADLAAGIDAVDRLLAGESRIALRAARDTEGLDLERAIVDTAELDLTAQGTRQGGVTRIDLEGGLRNLGVFVDGFNGPLSVSGVAREQAGTWSADGAVEGPAGARLEIAGEALRPDGTMDLSATGNVPLAYANPFIAPRVLEGTARLDLALAGAPGLEALAGTVTVAGARASDPGTRLALEDIGLTVRLADARAALALDSRLSSGGRVTAEGPVGLTAPFPADIALRLVDLRLVDPAIYETQLAGQIDIDGPLSGGAAIGGRIDVGRTEIRIPNTLGAGGTLLDVRHLGEPAGSRRTRGRAGLLSREETGGGGGGGGGPAYPLDILISAPNQIFVRGRGLDVEMGGEIRITGTTARPVPTGGLELIRGRLDLLSRRLEFETAEISMQGDLMPDLNLVAASSNDSITARIAIEGPLTEPEITLSSEPELPEDEVLAQLFFNKPLDELTPLEVAQLASAVNRLRGGSGGVFGFARETLGVDSLSVATDQEGTTSVTAGRYITERIYTDVTVGGDGSSEVQLNLDLTDDLKARTRFSNDGDTGIGFVFERDY